MAMALRLRQDGRLVIHQERRNPNLRFVAQAMGVLLEMWAAKR